MVILEDVYFIFCGNHSQTSHNMNLGHNGLDLLNIPSKRRLFQVIIFYSQDFGLNVLTVIQINILLDPFAYLLKLVQDLHPVLFSDTKSFTVCFGKIAEYCADIKRAIVGTDHDSI